MQGYPNENEQHVHGFEVHQETHEVHARRDSVLPELASICRIT
jgi:hypothetical protein